MKIYSIIIFAIIPLFYGCLSKAEKLESNLLQVKKPLNGFQKDSISVLQGLEKFFRSTKEYNLNHLDYECFRFIYFDSFGKHKLFKIEHFSDADNRLQVKFYERAEELNNNKYNLLLENTLDLTQDQYKNFKKLVDGSYFWSLRMIEYPQPMYLDGYAFLLEGFQPETISKEQRYHMVFRHVPNGGSFRLACEKLIEFYKSGN